MITAKVQKLKEYRRQIRESRCPVLENISTYKHDLPKYQADGLKKKKSITYII